MAMEPLPLGFGDPMDAAVFSSLWSFQYDDHHVQPPQESVEELKQSLVATRVELEAAKEELKKKEQCIAKLADLVRQVAKERDQLQHLLLAASSPAPAPPPAAAAALVTSSVTDSDCSLVSSPVDPFFDPVTSSDSQGKLGSPPPAAKAKQSAAGAGADAVLDMLAKKRPLPQRGRLLQSVMEAGPLLQNLLVAGLLPRWRNPPPVHKLDTLPVGVRACATATVAYGAPLAGATATAVLGYDGVDVGACMKRPMAVMCTPAMAMAATSCSPGFGAKRLRLH